MRFYWVLIIILWLPCRALAQSQLLLYSVDGQQSLLDKLAGEPEDLNEAGAAYTFLQGLVPALQEKGYLAASIDSLNIKDERYEAFVFLGKQYKWAKLSFDSIPASLWTEANINPQQWQGEKLSPKRLSNVSEKLLRWAEDNGYPFAKVWLADVDISEGGGVSASIGELNCF